MNTDIFIHERTYLCTYSYIDSHVHIHKHIYAHTYIYGYINICIYIHIYINAYTVFICINLHKRVNIEEFSSKNSLKKRVLGFKEIFVV
jgi:hypothetical protein